MKRRDFLKTSGYFVAMASLGGIGCGDDGGPDGLPDASTRPDGGTSSADAAPPDGTPPLRAYRFPQGVASGDPRETSVVLWTRVEAEDADADPAAPATVVAEVSTAADFSAMVLREEMTVTQDSDHTLRLVVTGLAAKTRYYYRFIAGTSTSPVGRTLTAPPRDDAAPVRLAWVSCQDYSAGTHGAYREIIKQDEAAADEDKIQFIVHVGDFIYETRAENFQGGLNERFEPITVMDRNGQPREIPPFPDGSADGEIEFAATVNDYRFLYKLFLSDPDLQAARARWPFIQCWDDHEFTNDNWQTQANYDIVDSLDEPSQRRKVAANQAWFEFVPAQLSSVEGVPGVEQLARDFVPTDVRDVRYSEVNADNFITEENNAAAIGSITIYRSFRYGQNLELMMTDCRSYRSDHAIPEELTLNELFFSPRASIPVSVVNIFDQGMTANGGAPPETVLGVPNPRRESPPGTILGAAQKQWLKDSTESSDAVWKLWGSSVPIMRLLIRNQPLGALVDDRVLSADAWDGYNSERKELMAFLQSRGIGNVVAISGDIHCHAAALIFDDFDREAPQPVMAEFCTAGVASNSVFSSFEEITRRFPPPLRQLVTYDSTPLGGSEPFVENLNTVFLHGTSAALTAAQTHSIPDILAAKDPLANPHLRYIDSNAQGYGTLTITPEEITATLVTIERPIVDRGDEGPGVKRTAVFTVLRNDVTSLSAPEVTGQPPFPLA